MGGGIFVTAGSRGVREDILVPLVFSGPEVGSRGFLVWEGFGASQEFRGEFALSKQTNRFGHEATSAYEELSWWADWHVTGHRDGRLFLGTGISSVSRSTMIESWDDAHVYWIGSLTAPLTIRQEFAFKEWEGHVSLSAAALALQSRAPAYYRTKQQPTGDPVLLLDRQFFDLEPTSPMDHLDLGLEALMGPAGNGWIVGASAGFVRASEPKPTFVLDGGLRVGYRWGTRR